MKSVAIVTHVDFWRQGAGHRSRIAALVKYLSRFTSLTIVFGGLAQQDDEQLVASLRCDFRLVYLDRNYRCTLAEYGERFKNFMQSNEFSVCIIEYIELSFLTTFIPNGVKIILDTHDIQSERNKSFEKFNLVPPAFFGKEFVYSEKEEFDIFRSYDAVVLINSSDYKKVSSRIGAEKAILAPHPSDCHAHAVKPAVRNVGFVASTYFPNVYAITWFIDKVWFFFRKHDITLNIYGRIAGELSLKPGIYESKNVFLKGFVADLKAIYAEMDIAVNPVMFGAGLKIKNVEALANGIPLITTSHAANGIEAGICNAFLVADTPLEFVDKLNLLVDCFQERRRLSENAVAFIGRNFTSEACFSGLLSYIAAV
jgi:glycosyltransferase involved in cell wall biosynthesis